MTQEVAINKVRTLKSAKYLNTPPLYAFYQKSDATKTLDVNFWSDLHSRLPVYVLYRCARTEFREILAVMSKEYCSRYFSRYFQLLEIFLEENDQQVEYFAPMDCTKYIK